MIELNQELTIMLDGFELKGKGKIIEIYKSLNNYSEQNLIIQLINYGNIYHIFAIYNTIHSTFKVGVTKLIKENEEILYHKNFEIDF